MQGRSYRKNVAVVPYESFGTKVPFQDCIYNIAPPEPGPDPAGPGQGEDEFS